MKFNDIVFLLMGIAVSAFGIKIIVHPKYESFRFGVVDFGDHHQLIGSAILIIGAFSIFAALKKKDN